MTTRSRTRVGVAGWSYPDWEDIVYPKTPRFDGLAYLTRYFDTIEINRLFDSDSVVCSIYVPFHGTELRRYSEEKGYISPGVVCSTHNADQSMLTMPQWDKEDISRLRNVFAMYVKFPKSRWLEYDQMDPALHTRLSEEFVEMFWLNPRARIDEYLVETPKSIF